MKWIKDNGQEIETNDRQETIDHCMSIGWTNADSNVIEFNEIEITEKDQKELIANEAMTRFQVKIPKTKSVENMQRQLDELKNGDV